MGSRIDGVNDATSSASNHAAREAVQMRSGSRTVLLGPAQASRTVRCSEPRSRVALRRPEPYLGPARWDQVLKGTRRSDLAVLRRSLVGRSVRVCYESVTDVGQTRWSRSAIR